MVIKTSLTIFLIFIKNLKTFYLTDNIIFENTDLYTFFVTVPFPCMIKCLLLHNILSFTIISLQLPLTQIRNELKLLLLLKDWL